MSESLFKLKKIVSKHNNLRTSEVVGVLVTPLEVGYPIVMLSAPLNGLIEHTRQIKTTPIKRIDGDRYYTENSVYEITPYQPVTYGRTIP